MDETSFNEMPVRLDDADTCNCDVMSAYRSIHYLFVFVNGLGKATECHEVTQSWTFYYLCMSRSTQQGSSYFSFSSQVLCLCCAKIL